MSAKQIHALITFQDENEHVRYDYLFYFDFAATVLVKLIHELRKLSLVHIYPHLKQRACHESEHTQQKQDQFTDSTRKS
jgi:hypothetical protein